MCWFKGFGFEGDFVGGVGACSGLLVGSLSGSCTMKTQGTSWRRVSGFGFRVGSLGVQGCRDVCCGS